MLLDAHRQPSVPSSSAAESTLENQPEVDEATAPLHRACVSFAESALECRRRNQPEACPSPGRRHEPRRTRTRVPPAFDNRRICSIEAWLPWAAKKEDCGERLLEIGNGRGSMYVQMDIWS